MELVTIIIDIFEFIKANKEIIIALSALLSSFVALAAIFTTLIIHYFTRKDKIKHDILENRKKLYFRSSR